MKRIPFDVIINHIIPYTYNVQSNILLEDIKNYFTIKEILINKKYDTNMIKHEILSVFYDNNRKLSTILYRHFQMKFKKKIIILSITSQIIKDLIYYLVYLQKKREHYF